MTSKEAKGNLMYALKWNDIPKKEALKIAIKALDNEDVLDKIRNDIEKCCNITNPYQLITITTVLRIIDKYKGE